jgi:hypothetical protein
MLLGGIFLRKSNEADDDDQWYWSMMAYQTLRLRSELFMFVNPIETFRIMRSPMASMSVIENVVKLLSLMVNPFDDENLGTVFEGGDWEGRKKASKILTNTLAPLAPIKQYMRWVNIDSQLNWFN